MHCKVTIDYDFEKDEVAIIESEKFLSLPAIHRSDALRDALYDLTNLYNKTIQQICHREEA